MAPRPRPEPLTPADCDLSGLFYMPLHIDRLKKSRTWLRVRRHPELAFYLVNLWSASWQQVPAASLENDDVVLCELAQCDAARWEAVRSAVLESWILCSDGRLYHPIVAEVAAASWASRQSFRDRLEKARGSKAQKKAEMLTSPSMIEPDTGLKGKGKKERIESYDSIPKKAWRLSVPEPTGADDLFLEPPGPAPASVPIKPEPKGHRLPPDWRPDERLVLYAKSRGLDPELVTENFVNYWQGVAGAAGRKVSWEGTFKNACLRAAERGEFRAKGGAPQQRAQNGETPSAGTLGPSGAMPAPKAWDDPPAWFHLCDGRSIFHEDGIERGTVNGEYLDVAAREIAEAAKLPENYNRWDVLIRWLNDGYNPRAHIVPTIIEISSRPGYKPPFSLAYFDKAVRRYSGDDLVPRTPAEPPESASSLN